METLIHNLVQATGWSILHSLWQSALIYGLLLPFQLKAFRLSARLKYALAYSSICLMFVSFVFTFSLLFQWPSAPVSARFINQAIALPASLSDYVEMLFPYLVFSYSLGLVIQCMLVMQGYRKVQQLKRAAYTRVPAEWAILFSKLTAELNLKKRIDFRLSEHVNVPLVIGFFKPVILFPVALAAQLDMKQVEAILIHELSHIRRNDYFFNLLRTMIDTILFFNPFVWLAGRFINIEREHACDDLVVKLTDTPLTYAHALLKLELITDTRTPVLALAATGNNQHLYQRIKRITDMKTNYANSKQKLFAVTLTIATIISLAWINPSEKEKPAKTIWTDKNIPVNTVEICVQDTGKKKAKKVSKVKTGAKVAALPPPPPVPPKAVVAPPPPPVEPETAKSQPVPPTPPQAPGLDIDFSPLTANLSNMMVTFSTDVKNMAMAHFNSADTESMRKMQVELQKKGMELQKKFNSPEERQKWQKIADEMRARYDNPKERAKLEKLAAETSARVNSKENREMIRKIQIQAKVQAEQAQKMVSSPEFKRDIQNIVISHQEPLVISFDNEETRKVKQSAEYLELKTKFDKDVQELISKKAKKEAN